MNKRFALGFVLLFIFSAPIFSQVKNKTIKRKVNKENKMGKDLDNKKERVRIVKYKTPGVYVEELPGLPPPVVQVETAIPAFIGYTEKGSNKPTQISSMVAYRSIFGGPSDDEIGKFQIDNNGIITSPTILNTPKYRMYYMLEMFFANGGGDCFIISAGHYNVDENSVINEEMLAGLERLNGEDLPTLILFPDAASSKNSEDPAELYKAALAQCAERGDRFLICDVEVSDNDISKSVEEFRFSIGSNNLEYGAACFPSLQTTLKHTYSKDKIQVKLIETGRTLVLRHTEESVLADLGKKEKSLYHAENGIYKALYQEIINIIDARKLVLPPGAAIAGVYAKVDASRGVWKAPANVSLNKVQAPTLRISDREQGNLNIHSTGKSINAIRSFDNRGVMVWGARTLAGNNNEWRYIQVRRFFNMVEESVRNATEGFVNEPNDRNTWMKVKALIDNYLITLWRAGALLGAKPEQAFYVKVGLNETMSARDVLEGRMIVEIGLAALRPAEFIVLRFSQKMRDN